MLVTEILQQIPTRPPMSIVRRLIVTGRVIYNRKEVWLSEDISPKSGDILQVGQGTWQFNGDKWLRVAFG